MKKFVMIIMAVALIALPAMAQQQEWKSTSAMPGTGSTYSPQIQQVGAEYAPSMASTTTETYSPAKAPGRPRRTEGSSSDGDFNETSENGTGDEGSPIGDAMLPMLLCAAAFCGVIALRRKRSALRR